MKDLGWGRMEAYARFPLVVDLGGSRLGYRKVLH
jgi:hypothetical protein